jgi:hypothetical protein
MKTMAQRANDLTTRTLAVDELPPNTPHAWIQWKGTEVCMDMHCTCGASDHIDADFAYFYRCSGCRKVYSVGANVRLHELTAEEVALVESGETIAPVEADDDAGH